MSTLILDMAAAEARQRRIRRQITTTGKSAVLHATLVVLALVAVSPLLWAFAISVTPPDRVYQWPPSVIPNPLTWESYANVLGRTNLPRAFLNSIIVSVGTTVISLLVGSMAAYRFARGRFPLRTFVLFVFIASIMIPGLTNVIPLYVLMQQLHLLNTHLGLVLVLVAANMPFVVWLLKGFIEGIPTELDEAAIIDGASRLQIFWHVILPLIRPGLSAAAVLTFVGAWNEFLLSLTLIQSPAQRTLQPAIQLFVGSYESTQWTVIAAATLIACVPVVILFMSLQRALIAGLTSGSVKG